MDLYDSAFRLYRKYKGTKYVPTSVIAPINAQIEKRFEKMNSEQGVMTFIAADPISVLAVIPDFKDYQILRMYPYSEKMVAADVEYTLSKGQLAAMRHDPYGEVMARRDKYMGTDISTDNWLDFTDCSASGYAFAQTYHTKDSKSPKVPPFGDAWRPNKVQASDGLHHLDENRSIQTWRMVFTHLGQSTYSNKQVRMAGRFKFALDMASQLQATTFELDDMHRYERHIDYEYARTSAHPPAGYYWQENVTINGDHRPDLEFAWRRPLDRTVKDVSDIWMQPAASVMLLNPPKFGEMFGPVLPPGMAGIDFIEGPLASIQWIGNLTYQVRDREGAISEERPWTEDTFLPIRKEWMSEAIGNFALEAVKSKPE